MAVFFAAVVSGWAVAGNGFKEDIIIREVKLNNEFTKIVIHGNADVMLTQAKSTIATIEDDAIDANNTRITNKNGVLTVEVLRNRRNRPVIKIPVSGLQRLVVNGNGDVKSVFYLKSEKLSVLINGTCTIALRVTGTISVEASEGYEYMYHKNEKVRIIHERE